MKVNFGITVSGGNDVKGDWEFIPENANEKVEFSWFQRAVKPKGKKAPAWKNAGGFPVWQESLYPNYVTSQLDVDVPAGTYLYRLYGNTTNGQQFISGTVEVRIN